MNEHVGNAGKQDQEGPRFFVLRALLHLLRDVANRLKFLRPVYFWIRYLTGPPWDTQVSPPELMAFIDSHPPGRALDMGCGTGTNVITLAQHGWEAVGVDFVRRAIEQGKARARAAGVNVDLRVADVSERLDLNGQFNLILDMGCLHSLPEESVTRYLDNVEHLLAPGGTYLLYAFTTEEKGSGPGVTPETVAAIPLELVERKETTERGRRPSAWLWFEKR